MGILVRFVALELFEVFQHRFETIRELIGELIGHIADFSVNDHLARMLQSQSYHVTLMERDRDRCEILSQRLEKVSLAGV